MKKISPFIFSLIISLLFCSCNSNNQPLTLFDLEASGDISDSLTDSSREWVTWKTEAVGRDTEDYKHTPIDKTQRVLKPCYNDDAFLPPDADCSVYLGEKDWDNYSLSFDFFMGESGSITFSVYLESDVKARFILWSDGRLSQPPAGSIKESEIKGRDGEPFIPDLDPDLWNSIELKPVNSKLVLFFNGEEKGEIYDLGDDPYGRFSLGGTMFKNIVAYC